MNQQPVPRRGAPIAMALTALLVGCAASLGPYGASASAFSMSMLDDPPIETWCRNLWSENKDLKAQVDGEAVDIVTACIEADDNARARWRAAERRAEMEKFLGEKVTEDEAMQCINDTAFNHPFFETNSADSPHERMIWCWNRLWLKPFKTWSEQQAITNLKIDDLQPTGGCTVSEEDQVGY